MDIKDQANLRFNKDRRLSSDEQAGKVSDGRGASAASLREVQPQDQELFEIDEFDLENKSHNTEADDLYSEADEDDLNASFDKGQGDTEGARSSLENDDDPDAFFGNAHKYQARKTEDFK